MLGEGVELVSVVETSAFSSQADEIWSDEEREEFVNFIAANPEAGRVITDTGGVRKIRWAIAGRGKRSGARVIYFFLQSNCSDLPPDGVQQKRSTKPLTKGQEAAAG